MANKPLQNSLFSRMKNEHSYFANNCTNKYVVYHENHIANNMNLVRATKTDCMQQQQKWQENVV